MSSCAVARRAMTAEESSRAGSLGPSASAWIYGSIFFGVVPIWLLGMIGGKAFDAPGLWGGRALGAAMFIAFALSFAKHDRKLRARAKADADGGEVEVLTVETSRAIELDADHSSVTPAAVIELGDGKLLLLDGQWATDPRTYGAADPPPAADPPWWNRLPPPASFPTRRFTLVRLPHSGEVLSIRPEGEYLKPEKTVGAALAKLSPRSSEVLEGSLDAVEAALASIARRSR